MTMVGLPPDLVEAVPAEVLQRPDLKNEFLHGNFLRQFLRNEEAAKMAMIASFQKKVGKRA